MAPRQSIGPDEVSIFIDQLEDPDKALAVTNNKVVGPWVQADCCQLELSCASVALFSLEAEGLVEAFGNIDI